MRWLDSVADIMNMNLGKFGEGGASVLWSMDLPRIGLDLVIDQQQYMLR